MKSMFREPILWFLVCGALVFTADYHLNRDFDQALVIRVDNSLREAIVAEQEALLGRPINSDEEVLLINRFIDEEIMVREAIRRGIHLNDGRIRQILLQKMNFLLGESPQIPDEDTLRHWFEVNRDRFRLPEIRTLDHVFFTNPDHASPSVLERLKTDKLPLPEGEDFWLGNQLNGYTYADIESVLGKNFAKAVFGGPVDTWFGPVTSVRGAHFVRVVNVRPPDIPSFESLKPMLTDEWIAERSAVERDRRLQSLRDGYHIDILPRSEATP